AGVVGVGGSGAIGLFGIGEPVPSMPAAPPPLLHAAIVAPAAISRMHHSAILLFIGPPAVTTRGGFTRPAPRLLRSFDRRLERRAPGHIGRGRRRKSPRQRRDRRARPIRRPSRDSRPP